MESGCQWITMKGNDESQGSVLEVLGILGAESRWGWVTASLKWE
jgi:hypothetical protein